MTQARLHRVGLIGAGNISEHHAYAIQDLPGCELLGFVDLDQDRAKAAAERHGVRAFESLDALVDAGATVVHVLTPPSSHALVALRALELGCHVLIEKPLAEDIDDCRKVGELARKKGLVASVNHSLLYDPQIVRAFDAVRAGKLGRIVSVDILRGSEYPPFEGGVLPPQYSSAGYPFRDLGVHCLYLIQELLGPIEDVEAAYRSLGGDPNLAFDEWRALVKCRDGLGQFQLSWNAKPIQSQLIIHGTNGIMRVDLFAMFHAKRLATPLPKAAERVLNTVTDSVQPLVDVPRGVWKFVRKEVKAFQGLRNLIADFYRRLDAGAPPPVTIEDATVVVDWVERIARQADDAYAARTAELQVSDDVPVLVTGASGKLGRAVVKRLLHDGQRVRMFQRRAPGTLAANCEVVVGDLGDPEAVDRAVRGARTVIHVGAAVKGGAVEHETATIKGTQHVLDACERHGVKRLVHISSMSVVDWAGSSDGDPVTETTALEPHAEMRGAYTRCKLEAEKLVAARAAAGVLDAVILRPGQIFGNGYPLLTGAVARRIGDRWLVLGDGELPLPLVYIDDLVDAIVLAKDSDVSGGEVLQLIDSDLMTQNEVLREVGNAAPVIRIGRPLVFLAGRLSEPVFRALNRQSPVGVYRLKSALARLQFDSDRTRELIGWQPRVGVREGVRREVEAIRGHALATSR
jgi:predicted dehydrogenase/nucleoside-diphosphate-sugar epimerase